MSLHLRNRPSTVGSNASLRPSTERRFAQRARRRRLLSPRPLLIGFAIIAAIAFLGWLVFGSVFLSVQKVAVSGEFRLSAASVKRAAQVPVNKPMVLLDVTAIRHRVEALPQVRSVTVERSWPNTVDITVVERKPVAVVKQNGKPLALVDPTGVLIANVSAVPTGMSVLALASPGPRDLSTKAALGVVVALPANPACHRHRDPGADAGERDPSSSPAGSRWSGVTRPTRAARLRCSRPCCTARPTRPPTWTRTVARSPPRRRPCSTSATPPRSR